jgi:hypothetical protein
MRLFNRWIARVLILCMMGAGMPLPALAGVVTTDQVSTGAEHERVTSFLDRAEVRAQLESLGVDANAARDRVAALTDDEAKQLAARIDELPAGGNVLGVLLTVFVILLITDILGFTKIFPFTRSIR